MTVYGIFTYDITDPEGYAAYSPGSLAIIASTMAKHGGKALFADSATRFEVGEKKAVALRSACSHDDGGLMHRLLLPLRRGVHRS